VSAPKPGDRVRVTYEAEWQGEPRGPGLLCIVRHWYERPGYQPCSVPDNATVEVLASPVYVNHDTTELRLGDVFRDAESGDKGYWIVQPAPEGGVQTVRFNQLGGISGVEQNHDLPECLTLLVRDGEVVR
jgi:hypothetical protein